MLTNTNPLYPSSATLLLPLVITHQETVSLETNMPKVRQWTITLYIFQMKISACMCDDTAEWAFSLSLRFLGWDPRKPSKGSCDLIRFVSTKDKSMGSDAGLHRAPYL